MRSGGAAESRRSRQARAASSCRSARSSRPETTRWSAPLSRTPALRACRPSSPTGSCTLDDPLDAPELAGALIEGEGEAIVEAARRLAARPGPIVRLQALSSARLAAGEDYNLADLVEECAIATNIAAAGGNASLMAIG